jgi:preprotein translocase subunit SecG
MLNTLLFVHFVIAILLITVILLQKTSENGLGGIGGGNNTGLVSSRSAANFMTRSTIILGVLFFANAIVLANLSSKSYTGITEKIEKSTKSSTPDNTKNNSVPIAK